MKQNLIAAVVVAITYLGVVAVSRSEDKGKPLHEIVIDAPDRPYVLGKPYLLRITYKNNTNARWQLGASDVLRQLDSEGYVDCVPTGKDGEHRRYLLDESAKFGSILLILGPQFIDGGDEYQFTHDVNLYLGCIEQEQDRRNLLARVTYRWGAGRWSFSVVNLWEKLESNRIEIEIVFTPESIQAMLDMESMMLDEEKADPLMQVGLANWLRKVRPDFVIAPFKKDDSPEQKAKNAAVNKKAIEDFQKFWEKEKNTDAMRALFKKIDKDSRASIGQGTDPKKSQP
jgi:hypothetical protein